MCCVAVCNVCECDNYDLYVKCRNCDVYGVFVMWTECVCMQSVKCVKCMQCVCMYYAECMLLLYAGSLQITVVFLFIPKQT